MTAAFFAFGALTAGAGPFTLHLTSTTLTVADAGGATLATDANGNLEIQATEQVKLTVTVTNTTDSTTPSGTVNLTTTDATGSTQFCSPSTTCSWNPTGTGNQVQAVITTTLSPGTYALQASFKGQAGSGYLNGSSSQVGVAVTTTTVDNTTTIVSASPSSITSGDSSTLTATVTSNDNLGTPSGTVEFYANEGTIRTHIGTGTLDANGQASITKSDWGVQDYTIEADYLGQTFTDSGGNTIKYQTSSGTTTLSVAAAVDPQVSTTTTVAVSPNPIRSDASVHIVANIAQTGSSTLSLQGTVTFTAQQNGVSGTTSLGQATLVDHGDGTGTAVLDKGGWVAGSYTITAQYFGNVNYHGSSGQTTTLVVNQAHPTTTTYVNDAQAYVDNNATLSARVVDTASGLAVPAGEQVTLTANDPSSTSCTATTNASGIAACTVQFSTVGTYSVSLSYPGDSTYDPSTGTGRIEVDKIPTDLTYTGDTTTSTGAHATLSGHLVDHVSGQPIANASVTLTLNGNESCTATTSSSGNASCTVTVSEGAGSYHVTAAYGGSGVYQSSAATGTVTVTTTQPTTLTYVGDTQVAQGSTATLAAKLVASGGSPLAGETVSLTLSTGETCTGTTNSSGVASCTVVVDEATTLDGSPYPISISFGGDYPYLASTGSGSIAVVAANPAPGVIPCWSHGETGAKCEALLADPTVVSNTQLTIVAMDDSAIPTTGSCAPTALLSNGQQLYATTSATSGQPQNYVDLYHGSKSSKYQTLITMGLPTGLSAGLYYVQITACDGDGDVDQWSWPLEIASDGTVTSLAVTYSGDGHGHDSGSQTPPPATDTGVGGTSPDTAHQPGLQLDSDLNYDSGPGNNGNGNENGNGSGNGDGNSGPDTAHQPGRVDS